MQCLEERLQKAEKSYVLWTNQNPTTGFESQNIELNSNDYDYYEVLFIEQLGSFNNLLSTGKIPKGRNTTLITTTNYANTYPQIFRREVNYINASSLKINNGYYQSCNSNNRSSNNQIVVPYQIIGYKTN